MGPPQVTRILKSDAFGRVELLRGASGPLVRRTTEGARPGLGWLARRLLARERRALSHLGDLDGLPRLVQDEAGAGPPGLLRTWLPGVPLWATDTLADDWFERLEVLVRSLHARGVSHGDLGKENNLLVLEDGGPGLVDFQLARVGPAPLGPGDRRVRHDLRCVAKHRRRYERAAGRPAAEVPPRPWTSRLWRAAGKPLLRLVTHGLSLEEREPRRPREGPWPRRVPGRD